MSVVYELIDPRTNAVRYVGQSRCWKTRLRQHLSGDSGGNAGKSRWLSDLDKCGQQPTLKVVWEGRCEDVDSAERSHIQKCLRENVELLNICDGGRGQKISKGNMLTREQWSEICEKLAQARALVHEVILVNALPKTTSKRLSGASTILGAARQDAIFRMEDLLGFERVGREVSGGR